MAHVRPKIFMFECPICHRLKKFGSWVSLTQLDDLEYTNFRRLYYDGNIEFTLLKCNICRSIPCPAPDLEHQIESVPFAHA